jgi:hypothetical protein
MDQADPGVLSRPAMKKTTAAVKAAAAFSASAGKATPFFTAPMVIIHGLWYTKRK